MPTKLRLVVLGLKSLGHLPDIHLMICSDLNFTGANFLEAGTICIQGKVSIQGIQFCIDLADLKPT